MKTVSIIITCYNQGKIIKETLLSAMNQSYKKIEVIIVDDGSTDEETINLLCQMEKEYKSLNIIHQINKGVSNARNTGYKNANGEYIVFLDGDDLLDRAFVEKTLSALEETGSKMAYSYTKLFGTYDKIWYLEKPNYQRMLVKNMIPLTCLVRKKDVENIGGFYEDLVKGIEDWDFWIRFFNEGDKVVRINKPLFYYRRQDISRNTELKKSSNDMSEMIEILHAHNEKIFHDYPNALIKNDIPKATLLNKIINRIDYYICMLKPQSIYII